MVDVVNDPESDADRGEREGWIDLGLGHTLKFVPWRPDRSIPENAELFSDIPDNPRAGARVRHPRKDKLGAYCDAYIGLSPALNTVEATWQVHSWDPLTLTPSLLCRICGDHGLIANGQWVPA